MNLIEVRNLEKYYENIHALKNISFDIKEGEFFGLLGVNGAGKSTTINIISTLLTKSSGDIIIGGFKVGQNDDKIRSLIGIVFQEHCLDEGLSVYENLYIRGSLYFSKKTIRSKVLEIIDTFNLDDIKNQYYGQLSGGQKRRVDIARALLHEPKILILDEPTTGIDPSTRKMVWSILNNLRAKGLTIILTTHYMEETIKCDRILVINKGEVVACESPNNLRDKYTFDTLLLYGNISKLEKHLFKYDYTIKNESVQLKIKSSNEAIVIINKLKHIIDSFEMIKGTMDDVFLNLTDEGGNKL